MIITVSVQKGGVGKTATAATLAQAATFMEKSVLAIDMDPQANLSFSLAAPEDGPGSKGLLDGIPAAELIRKSPQGMDVIPAPWDLIAVKSSPGSARRLQTALEPIRSVYDYIIIDTPSTAGELQYNAIQAAEAVLIPLQADSYSVKALRQVMDAVKVFQKTNARLQTVYGCITMYDGRSTIAKQMAQLIREAEAALDVMDLGTIRAAVAIKEAAALRQSIYDYAPRSKPAADYLRIFERIDIHQ